MTDPLADPGGRIQFQPPAMLPSQPPANPEGDGESPVLSTPSHTDATEARKLGTLLDVSQALAGSISLQAGLSGVLDILARRCGAERAAVAFLDEHTRELQVRASIGLGREGSTTRFALGEGISGTVAALGEAIIVPQISRDERFLHRAVTRRERRGAELSFV